MTSYAVSVHIVDCYSLADERAHKQLCAELCDALHPSFTLDDLDHLGLGDELLGSSALYMKQTRDVRMEDEIGLLSTYTAYAQSEHSIFILQCANCNT